LLRVTAPVSLGFLGGVLSSFLENHPQVELDFVCTDRVVDLVEDGFDVALRAGQLADSSLVARPLATFRRYAVASPRYLESRPAPKQPEELREHSCLSFGPSSPRGVWRLEDGKRRVELVVRGRFIVNDVDMLREVTLAGHGIALLPDHNVDDDLRAGRLVRVLPDWRDPETPFHAVYPSTRHLSPKVRAFVEHLTKAMKSPSWERPQRRHPR
jgi:DNA-binding transcriptional LysR family regulator